MRNNKPNRSVRWILAAAIAAPVMGLFSSSAEAQFQQGQNGGARDANNRVGSGGRNASAPKYGTGVTPDMIIYGNVTNSKYFRGPVGAPDARAFRGDTADIASDRFIRDSAGGYDRVSGSQIYNTQAYYGESRGVAAPTGYVPTKTTQVYTNSPFQMNNAFSPAASLGAMSLGEGYVPRFGGSISTLPTPGTGTAAQAGLVMTPLGGIRQLGFGEEAVGGNDIYAIRNGQIQQGLPTDRFRTDGQTIDKIRDEISTPDDKTPSGPQGAQPIGKPLENPASGELKAPTVGGGALGQPIAGGLETGQGFKRQLATASQQSEQMSELEKRLAARTGGKPSGLDIQRDIATANARKPQPVQPKTPGAVNPATPGAVNPGANPPVAPAPGVDPLMIKSLATGIKAKSLADVLTNAETLMKEGKFAEALDQYDLAERAAPNNALITLGRANAELGASSYRSAETNLRAAISSEPALLLAKYDLKGMIGAERLAILTKDLRDLAANEPRESTANFLLAYIHYNTGNEAEAAAHLAEVEKRKGAADPQVSKMRELWNLPSGAGLNK